MVSFTKNSLGFTALAATSTLGAWLIWRALSTNTNPPPSTKNSTKSKKKKEQGLFDFLNSIQGTDSVTEEEGSHASSSSSINTEDLEQVWTDNNEVDIKIFKKLVEEKQEQLNRPPRSHSKLSLYSHLISKLEQTLDEQHRIEDKLDHLKHLHDNNEPTVTVPRAIASASSSNNNNNTDNLPSSTTTSNNNNNNASVCMVVQRYRGATLLINENQVVRVGAKALSDENHIQGSSASSSSESFCGLLVYVSFAKGCTQQTVQAAYKIIVNLPVLTMGAWGDGTSETMNVMDLAKKYPSAASIVIVPQANLINKVKSQGKSIQYHGQIDKSEGNTMYHYFVNCVRGLVLEQQCQVRKEVLPDWYQKSVSAQSGNSPSSRSSDPSMLPEDLFRDPTLYASWDDHGIPLTDAEDEPITKSAQKKMRKAQAAHRVRHLKYLRDESRQPGHKKVESSSTKCDDEPHQHIEHWATAIDPAFCNVVAGTFGKRQSLEFIADMGPFCHVIQV